MNEDRGLYADLCPLCENPLRDAYAGCEWGCEYYGRERPAETGSLAIAYAAREGAAEDMDDVGLAVTR